MLPQKCRALRLEIISRSTNNGRMAGPGRNIEHALLKSGRKLYAQRGSTGLAVRALTEHARVNLGMFHYHFRTKDEFVRRLLSGWYEDMFEQLTGHIHQDGSPLRRL